MDLRSTLQQDMKRALKSGDKLTLSTLRMLQSKILEREVDLRSSRGRDYHLNDQETIDVLAAYAKQRRQSIESYRQGGREDLAEREQRELAVVEAYLPAPLDEAGIEALVARHIEETGATGLKDLGRVIKAVMAEAKGTADGKIVNQITKRVLLERQNG
ncbi:MAG: GatB/YqeY domain-containing protein [Acidobacteriota bacterium]